MTCLINSFEKAKEFVLVANNCEGEISVCQDHFVVNGKSIVGVLSLNLLNPIEVKCEKEREQSRFSRYEKVPVQCE